MSISTIPVTFAPTTRIHFSGPKMVAKLNRTKSPKQHTPKPLTQGNLYKMFRVGLDRIFSKVLSHELDTLNPEEYSFILFFSAGVISFCWTAQPTNKTNKIRVAIIRFIAFLLSNSVEG